MIKHESRVTSRDLQVTTYEFKSTSWNSRLRVQIHELRAQIHEFKNHLVNENYIPPCAQMCAFRVTPSFACAISSPVLTFFVCRTFLVLFYLRNSEISDAPWVAYKFFLVSNTHHFLASHSVPSSLPRKAFSLMVASNC